MQNLIDAHLTCVEQLLELLDVERTCLEQRDADRLQDCFGRKQEATNRVQASADALASGLASALDKALTSPMATPLSNTSGVETRKLDARVIEAFLNSLPAASQSSMREKFVRIDELSRAVMARNQANGVLIELSRRNTEMILESLTGRVPSKDRLYQADGRLKADTRVRSLGAA
jgi:flagellar biosynthesis/type III secretory pathway chaperone